MEAVEALEVEVKIRFEKPEAARRAILAATGVEKRSRYFEENRIFDTPGRDLAARGALLRIRCTSDGEGLLTFKEKVESEVRAKVRKEWEVRIDSPETLATVLTRAGFVTTYTYQKYRTVFRIGEAVVDLDETPMGCFVEIEGSPDSIREAAARLGARQSDFLVEDYRTIYHAWLAERGLPPADMVFPDRSPGGERRP